MTSNKTVANNSSVHDFINSLDDPVQRADSTTLLHLFERITDEKAVMWGTAIIGFGSVNLTYTSGRTLDWFQVGFSPRKGKMTLYVTFDAQKLTSMFPSLGKYTIGKGCIYITKLADVDMNELEKLVKTAWDAGYESPERADGKEQIL